MKNKRMIRLFSIPLVLILSSLTACSSTTLPMLKAKAKASEFSYSELTDAFNCFVDKANNYALPLIENLNKKLPIKENSAYSPASLFYATAMLSKIVSNEDKTNLLRVLGTSEEEINQNIPSLYRACNQEYTRNRKTTGRERVDNSIWLDEMYKYDEQMLEDLANIFYTDSFSCNFKKENKKANKAISDYAKDCTEGLLEPNYEFDELTTFVLLNTLYFDDIWNADGLDLQEDKKRDFNNYDDSKTNTQFYFTYYEPGKIIETSNYKSMYARTLNNFKINFVVPKDGVDVEDLFTEEILKETNSLDYVFEQDEDNEIVEYCSRISTPEFDASFDDEILDIFYETYKLDKIDDFYDFITNESPNTEFELNSIVHTTKVEFRKDKVKAAAATAISCGDTAAPMPRKTVYDTLIIDRPFIYSIVDPQGINLFQGVVYKI